jgi:hypothetical protein
MSWINENKFLATLAGGTLAGVIILFALGYQGMKSYDGQKEAFETASTEVKAFESGPLYPKTENKNAKSKALNDYKAAVESLQSAFEPFRPKELTAITPQEFTSQLLAANTETRKAFETAGTVVPDPYFVGFERYKTSLADGKSTAVLDYQLGFVKNLMLTLAKAKPAELKNLYRPLLPEDEGQVFTAPADMVARPLSLELTFTGSELSVREFITSISKPDERFVVVRSLRITNTKKDAPKSSDAQFEKPAAAKPAGAADPFAGGFILPGEEPAAATPAPKTPKAPDAPAPAEAAPGGRILAQVLGTEQVNVFLRIDLLQFLPAKKLP